MHLKLCCQRLSCSACCLYFHLFGLKKATHRFPIPTWVCIVSSWKHVWFVGVDDIHHDWIHEWTAFQDTFDKQIQFNSFFLWCSKKFAKTEGLGKWSNKTSMEPSWLESACTHRCCTMVDLTKVKVCLFPLEFVLFWQVWKPTWTLVCLDTKVSFDSNEPWIADICTYPATSLADLPNQKWEQKEFVHFAWKPLLSLSKQRFFSREPALALLVGRHCPHFENPWSIPCYS